jgi:hypothetical protein
MVALLDALSPVGTFDESSYLRAVRGTKSLGADVAAWQVGDFVR